VTLRQPDGVKRSNRQVFIDPELHKGIYPAADSIRPGRPVIVAEGELDSLLLGKELTAFDVGIITLGSASMRPTAEIRAEMLPAFPWIIALMPTPRRAVRRGLARVGTADLPARARQGLDRGARGCAEPAP